MRRTHLESGDFTWEVAINIFRPVQTVGMLIFTGGDSTLHMISDNDVNIRKAPTKWGGGTE